MALPFVGSQACGCRIAGEVRGVGHLSWCVQADSHLLKLIYEASADVCQEACSHHHNYFGVISYLSHCCIQCGKDDGRAKVRMNVKEGGAIFTGGRCVRSVPVEESERSDFTVLYRAAWDA